MDTCLIFPLKTARDPRQRDMVADFFSHIYCMVPTGPNSRGLILPLSDFLLVLTEGFYLYSSTRHLLEKNQSKGPEHRTTIFSAILCRALDTADNAQTLDINLVIFTVWILRKKVRSLDLPPSLAVPSYSWSLMFVAYMT